VHCLHRCTRARQRRAAPSSDMEPTPMSRLTVAALAATLFAAPAPALPQGIIVEGIPDCGLWVKARSTDRSAILEEWLVGFLNGIAVGTQTEFWHAGGIPINREQVYLWMDKYCREEPLSRVIEGAFRLHAERHQGNVARSADR
jgi:hypothetical protein